MRKFAKIIASQKKRNLTLGVLGVLVGELGSLFGVLGVLVGILGVLVGLLGILVGVLGVFGIGMEYFCLYEKEHLVFWIVHIWYFHHKNVKICVYILLINLAQSSPI